ncbi:MAG: PAS domain S-box protein, partial [Methanomassiliicoccales archaeon]|nr:PAS domain S-box protein [Methanomassiliicoccales archaeon]
MISVLCVDDEPGFLELTRAFLELQGDIIVYGSPSALQAIDMLKTHSYDAVVSDYQMPGMDGLKFLAHVRNRHDDLPFILFTGKGREEVVIQALNSGADFYLQKGGEAKSQFAELAHKVRQAVERKNRNDALSLAEFSVDNAAVITIWSDEEGRILKANKAAAQLLGFTQKELHGMRLGDLDQGLAETIGGRQVQMESGRQVRRKSNMRRKDGTLLPVDITDNYFIMGGRKYGLSFGLDVSESQKAESALRHSEERFQALVENANSIIIKADLDGRITYANNYALSFFGYSAEELLGRKADETISPRRDGKEGGLDVLLPRALSDVDRYRIFENENVRKDGSRAWVSWTNTAVRDENGVCLELLSIGNDITPLKEAELKLRASQGRLMEAQRLGRLGDLYYEISPKGDVQEVIWSEEAYRIMGFEKGQKLPSMEEIEHYVHPSDRERWRASLASVTQNGGSVEFEHRVVLKSGEVRHVQVIFKTVMHDDGGRRYIGVVRDLSEVRRAEEALRESERRYRTIADLIPDFMYVVDAQGVVRYVNHGIVKQSGRAPEELLGKHIEALFAPNMAARQREDLSRVIESKEPLRLEIREDDEGRSRWLDVALVPVLAPDGGVAEVIGTSRDITKIKRAEEELWEVASSYRNLTENITGLVYRVHLRENERLQMFNDMLLPLTGYKPEEISSDYYSYAKGLIDPEDSRWVLASVREAVEFDRPFDIEYRLRCKDGKVIHVRDRGKPIRGADGTPLYIDGVMFDDSERKRSEVAVRDKERKFRELADMLPAFVFETDEEGGLTFVNETARAMVGVGREELSGHKVRLFEFLDPEDHERAMNRFSALRDGETCMGEAFEIVRRDGSRFQATMHCVPIIMDGSLKGMRGLFVDISALRESERIQEAVHSISQAALIEENLDDLYKSIHATLRGLMPLDNFYIAIYDEERDEISFPYFVDQKDPRPSTRRKGKGMSEYLLRTGQPILTTMDGIRHLQESGEIELIGTPPMDFMAAPLVVEGKTIGLMVAQNYDPRSRFSPKHLEMMKFVSHQVAMAIKSKRQQVELSRYTTLLQSTFESTDDGILIVDAYGRVLAANDRFTKMWCIPESIAK